MDVYRSFRDDRTVFDWLTVIMVTAILLCSSSLESTDQVIHVRVPLVGIRFS